MLQLKDIKITMEYLTVVQGELYTCVKTIGGHSEISLSEEIIKRLNILSCYIPCGEKKTGHISSIWVLINCTYTIFTHFLVIPFM